MPQAGANFSFTLQTNTKPAAAIAGIDEQAWIPVRYPGATFDQTTKQWISDAEVAETPYTAFESTTQAVTARLVVRRVRERNLAPPGQEELFPIWRYHQFLTDDDSGTTVEADLTHRAHAIQEQVFADLIDVPLAHLPSGRFAANAAWLSPAAMAHNLTRAAGCLADGHAGGTHGKARAATIRRKLILIPARIARHARLIIHPARRLPVAPRLAAAVHRHPQSTGHGVTDQPYPATIFQEQAGTRARPIPHAPPQSTSPLIDSWPGSTSANPFKRTHRWIQA